MIWLPIAFTAVAGIVAVILSETPRRWQYALAKGAAAVGFVWVAIASGALGSVAGRLTLGALVASGIGDVALAYRDIRAFLSGAVAFAAAHVLFTASFVVRGLDAELLVWSIGLVLVVSGGFLGWLLAYTHGTTRVVVIAYTLIVSVMLATSWASSPFTLRALGATALYASDVAVARDRFVKRSRANKVWGLPLYYGGQVLLALSAR